MDMKDLVPFVLMVVLVGMVVGVGLISLDRFSTTTFYQRSNYNDSISLTLNNTRYALDYGNITGVNAVWNGTNNLLSSSCYEIYTTNGSMRYINDTADCAVFAGTARVLYDFKEYNTATRNAVNSASNEVSGITTNWLGLIVTIFVLSIIVVLVVKSFGFGGTR